MNAYVETYARLGRNEISVLAQAVEELGAEEGDRVETGQVAILDKKARAAHAPVRASHNEVKSNYERIKVLHEDKMVSQAEYETTQLRFENSKVDLEEAELNGFADVEAPISGVIVQRMLVGTLPPDQELFFIADMDPLLVHFCSRASNVSTQAWTGGNGGGGGTARPHIRGQDPHDKPTR